MAALTIIFLGTGTSVGVPKIGCNCRVCTSDDPRDKRSRSSVAVRTDAYRWVIDTGPDFRSQCLREDIRHLDAVLFTHSHTDHIMGFDDLRRFCHILQGPMPVYASADTMEFLRKAFDFAFVAGRRSPGYLHPIPHIIDQPFKLDTITVTPLLLPHGRCTVTGFLHSIDERPLFAYLSDCNDVPEEVIDLVRGVDTLVIDGLRYEPHPTHLTIPAAIAIARRIAPNRTFLTHLSCEVSHAETEAALPDSIHLAYDGLALTIA